MAGTAHRRFAILALALAGTQGFAQSVISTHAGLVHTFEGTVSLDGQLLTRAKGRFPQIQEGSSLTTGEGRAEVLLVPGVLLWIGSNTTVRLQKADLTDTRVEVLSGSAVVESTELAQDNAVTLVYGDAAVQISAPSLYRIDAPSAEFAVIHGTASVETPSGNRALTESQRFAFTTAAITSDSHKPDALEQWSLDRSRALALETRNGVRMAATANPPRKVAQRRGGPYRALMVFVSRRP